MSFPSLGEMVSELVARVFGAFRRPMKPRTWDGQPFRVCLDGDVEEVAKFAGILKEEIGRVGGSIATGKGGETYGIIGGSVSVEGVSRLLPAYPGFSGGGMFELDTTPLRRPVIEVWVKVVTVQCTVISAKGVLAVSPKCYDLYPDTDGNGDEERRKVAKQIVAELSLA